MSTEAKKRQEEKIDKFKTIFDSDEKSSMSRPFQRRRQALER